MYKITIKGQASTSHKNLSELDGISCQDIFSEYFDDDSYTDDVTGGYMYFKYNDGKLWTITTYNSNRELTKDELNKLGSYTQGQWSGPSSWEDIELHLDDGIGEGFEQNSCMEDDNGNEVYISPWFGGQTFEITQTHK